jgi:hypothetical protein
LYKIRLQFFHSFDKGIVPRFLPRGGTHLFSDIGGTAKNTSKETAGGIHCAGDRPSREGLKTGAISRSAAVTIEFELETAIGIVF